MAASDLTRSKDERAQPERAARDRAELYSLLTEHTNDFIRLYDLDGRSAYASPSVERLHSRVLTTLFELAHPEDVASCQRWWKKVLAGETDRLQWRVGDAGGRWRWLETSPALVQYHDRPHVLTVCRDVTERKQAEARVRLIIDAIPAMVFSALPDGSIDYINQRWRQFLGLPLESVQGWEWAETIHSEDRARTIDFWRSTIAAGQAAETELRVRRADGVYRWLLGRSVPLRDESGKIVRWYGVSTDIDDRKRAEQTVHQSQELLQLVLATLPVGVAVTDLAGDIVLANAASKRIWGGMIVSGGERWAQSRAFWHESGQRIDPESWASVRALSQGQTSLNELIDIETFDGQKKTIQNSAAPMRNPGGVILGAVIVNEDVTERVRAEQALAESAERLHHLSRRLLEVQEEERRHLARELHDEFGQLLTGLRLLLKPDGDVPVDAARTRIEQARSIADQLLEQVRGMSFDLRPAALDQLGLLPALLTLFERYRGQTGVLVDFKHQGVEGRFPSEVETAAYRVVQEALTNVARHTGAAGVTVRVWAASDMLNVQVEDQGRGFDTDATLASLQSHGLAGMQERVRLLGGKLTIESRPGAGTQITAELPLPRPEGPR